MQIDVSYTVLVVNMAGDWDIADLANMALKMMYLNVTHAHASHHMHTSYLPSWNESDRI